VGTRVPVILLVRLKAGSPGSASLSARAEAAICEA